MALFFCNSFSANDFRIYEAQKEEIWWKIAILAL